MKPHIYMYRWGNNMENVEWCCEDVPDTDDEYFCGIGDTPQEAYEDWKRTKERLETGEERFV